ncbi:MAG: hypothetical protein P0S95_02815 [Rhabdochlamydiaceae bacterium]|nr:hypothetical protein [Candidatus Amphrikana amoebophyrae]
MYSILISQIDLRRESTAIGYVPVMMMIGYIVGVLILRLKRVIPIPDEIIFKWGYFISFFSLFPYFLGCFFFENIGVLLGLCYFLHAIGNSFLSPALLTMLSKEKPHHEQGKILGLVESFDSIAFLFSVGVVMVFNYLQFPIVVLVLFSFVSFAISLVYYSRFQKSEPSCN